MLACTSLNSRTFSMAMTAWSAKVLQQLDVMVGKRAGLRRVTAITPIRVPCSCSGEYKHAATATSCANCSHPLSRLGFGIGDLNDLCRCMRPLKAESATRRGNLALSNRSAAGLVGVKATR